MSLLMLLMLLLLLLLLMPNLKKLLGLFWLSVHDDDDDDVISDNDSVLIVEYLRLSAPERNVLQVFFKAGTLGQLEELRDDRLAKIITWMQSYVRGYQTRKNYKKLQDQRYDYRKILEGF